MSDDEDDIWGYKSIWKHRASDREAARARKPELQAKRGGAKKRNASRKTKSSPAVAPPISPAQEQSGRGPGSQRDALCTPNGKAETMKTPSPATPELRHSGHCPSCQMPFSILLVQTPRWHASECLDATPAAQTECPDGLRCSSTLPSHYKRFSHFLLAQSRAADYPLFSSPSTPERTLPKAAVSNSFSPRRADTPSVKKGAKRQSPKSGSPSSSQESLQRTPLDVWLSSPSKASQNSSSSSQETFTDLTAAKCQRQPLQDAQDSAISYSPLVSDQELFSEDEGDLETLGRTPHPSRSSPDYAEAIERPSRCNKDQSPGRQHGTRGGTWSGCSTPVSDISEWPPQGAADLRSDNQHRVFPIATQGDEASANSQPHASNPQLRLAVKTPQLQEGAALSSQAMPSVPPAKAMKQMDIGVFFGLKPKVAAAVAEAKVPLKSQSLNAVASQMERPPRKRKATGSVGDASEVVENLSGMPAATGTQKRGGKRFRQNSTTEERGRGRKQCPFYKKIPGTGFAVDAFQYGEIEGCSAYFLTHFHSDHYGGLTKKFRFPIYCSKITGNLVQSKLRVEKEFINCLPMYTECTVNGIRVVLLDANHCPGAVLLLFILPNGTAILHTGDFRAETSMERYPALLGRKIHTLYLDTTYCSPEYTFPPQQEAVQFAVNAAFEMVTLHPRTLVVCGTYSVGKEKVFLAIADILGCKVCMSQEKYKTMQCLESAEISARVTTDWHSTALHVLPMMQLHFKGLSAHLSKFSGKYDRVLAFKPTGWTYSEGCRSVTDIRPQIRGKITVYGIPYSEHSSFSEMKRFVQFLKPQKIIPTVNVGSGKSRAAMERHFAEWLSETRS